MKPAVRAAALERGLHPERRPVRGMSAVRPPGGKVKLASVLLVLGCLLSAVSGQVLERTIHLGDTWRLPADPVAFAYDSRDKTVFIGGDGCDSVLVLDEHTIEPLGWIDVGAPVSMLAYCRALNKLYCLHSGSISVYDAASHARLRAFPAPIAPTAVCVDSEDSKLYIHSGDSATLTTVDCNADSVVGVLTGLYIEPDEWPWRQSVCYVPVWDRVYCCDYDSLSVLVIDCRTDSVIARIGTPAEPMAICYNSANDRVYAIAYSGGPFGIDVATNTVVSTADGYFDYGCLFCNPRQGKLYGLGDGCIVSYDCASDSFEYLLYLECSALFYSSTANKVYAAGDWWGGTGFVIVDGEGDTLIDFIENLVVPSTMGSTSDENLVFMAMIYDELAVFDGDRGYPVRVWSPVYELTGACSAVGTGKIFCSAWFPSGFEVMDAGTGQATAFIPTGHEPLDLCCDTVNNVVYAVGGGNPMSVAVVDVSGGSMVNVVRLAGQQGDTVRVCADSRDRKVYIGTGSDKLMVYNWSCDSLLRTIRVPYDVQAIAYHAPGNRIYCGTYFGILEVNCVTDDVVRTTDLGCSVNHFCFGSAGDRVYCVGDDELVTVDCRTATITGRTSLPGRVAALCYNPTDDKVYCGGESDSVCVLAGSDGHRLVTLPIGPVDGPWSLTYDSRSNTMLCVSAERRAITFVDGQSNRVRAVLPVGRNSYSIATADGFPFAFACGSSDIAVIRKDSTVAEFGVSAAPGRTGGSLVRGRLFSTDRPGSVLLNAAGRKVAGLHPGMNDVSGLAPGVYFVTVDGSRSTVHVRKVVIAR